MQNSDLGENYSIERKSEGGLDNSNREFQICYLTMPYDGTMSTTCTFVAN